MRSGMSVHLMKLDGVTYREIDHPEYEPAAVKQWEEVENSYIKNAERITFGAIGDTEWNILQIKDDSGLVFGACCPKYIKSDNNHALIIPEYSINTRGLTTTFEKSYDIGEKCFYLNDNYNPKVIEICDNNAGINDVIGVRSASGEILGISHHLLIDFDASSDEIRHTIKELARRQSLNKKMKPRDV